MHRTSIAKTATTPLYFIYDGDCPICRMAADLFVLRQRVGVFHTVDARRETDHPVLAEITDAGLDLDQGMVIKYQGALYHGDRAFLLMSQLGEPLGWFNRLTKILAPSRAIARLSYPIVRSLRNLLLWILGVKKINKTAAPDPAPKTAHNAAINTVRNQPIFQPIFQDDWEKLPPVMLKHYANRPYCNDISIVHGRLDVMCRWYLKPVLWFLGTVPPHNGTDVPVTVRFVSQPHDAGFGFERLFEFPHRPPVKFHSRMFHRGGAEIVEHMRFGICWHATYGWDGQRVTLTHKGYSLRIGRRYLNLPVTGLIGRGDAHEIPIDDHSFAMAVSLSHPLLGKIYSYAGTFTQVTTIDMPPRDQQQGPPS